MKSAFSSRSSSGRNGTWKPYIPQIGTPNGCRVEPRGNEEKFYITHAAKVFSDSCSEGRRVYKDSSANSSSVTGVGIPKEGNPEPTPQGRRTFTDLNKLSMGSGLNPGEPEKLFATRPQQGRVNEESMNDSATFRVRINSSTLIPPDNLTLGLQPLVDYDSDSLQRNRCCSHRNASSLGAGFQPIPEESDGGAAGTEADTGIPQEYRRVYGIIR
jgi:hypothetical protein